MEYKYIGIELTPAVFRELLIQLFDVKQFNRQEAITIITKHHYKHGGLLIKFKSVAEFTYDCESKDAIARHFARGVIAPSIGADKPKCFDGAEAALSCPSPSVR